jgi:hypothetical protein
MTSRVRMGCSSSDLEIIARVHNSNLISFFDSTSSSIKMARIRSVLHGNHHSVARPEFSFNDANYSFIRSALEEVQFSRDDPFFD